MKNVLVQYQGGGYDGCIWEWNYFYLDRGGKFHDVWHTGCAGIDSQEDAMDLLSSNRSMAQDKPFVYDLTDENVIEMFGKESNPGHVFGVLQWFNANREFGVEFFARCKGCGEKIYCADDASLQEWHGCGGIMFSPNALICHICREDNTCDVCGEYVGEDEILSLYGTESDSEFCKQETKRYEAIRVLIDDGYSAACTYCIDAKAQEIEEAERAELLLKSLATGKPDLFSGEMRWLFNA